MRAMAIKFLVLVCVTHVSANVLKNIFNGFGSSPAEEHDEDCPEIEHSHPGFIRTISSIFTSPGPFWRKSTSPDDSYDNKREDTMRYTTESWRPRDDVSKRYTTEDWRTKGESTRHIIETWKTRDDSTRHTTESWRTRVDSTRYTTDNWRTKDSTRHTIETWRPRDVSTRYTTENWRLRDQTSRYTTESWRPRDGSVFTNLHDNREVSVSRETSTYPPRRKPTSGQSFGNEVDKDSSEGVSGVKMRLAEKWCSRYETKCQARRTTRNGITTRIIGGRHAQAKKHPHMARIGYGVGKDKEWLCGGSLISSRYVLSAAHCSQTMKLGPARWVLLGELDISTTDDDAKPQEREIVERLRHPRYREPIIYHDIALFKMDRDVVFSSWVYPTCLNFNRNLVTTRATVTGWGRTGFVSEVSKALLEVDLSVFNDTLCTSRINKLAGPKMPSGYDARTMICAGDIAGGKDACQGDSGGPLVFTDDSCIKTQIGITSIGSDCGLPESPGVYTRVSEYVSWIESIVWS